MRILLDANTPRQVRGLLPGHDEAEKASFDALITSDQNFAFQQNLTGRNIAVVILSTNRWAIIRAQPQAVQRGRQRFAGNLHLRHLRPAAPIPAATRSHLLIASPTQGRSRPNLTTPRRRFRKYASPPLPKLRVMIPPPRLPRA
jgi:hypothetical protein